MATRIPADAPTPNMTGSAASWTLTANPTATTPPTPTNDPNVYEYVDPAEDCVDTDDQPQACLGNDIIRVQPHSDWPSLASLPESPPEGTYPLAWIEVDLANMQGLHDEAFLNCVSVETDNDPGTGLKEAPLTGTEVLSCVSPGMAEMDVSEYGPNGEFIQDGFFPSENLTFPTDDGFLMGVCTLDCFSSPTEIDNEVSISLQFCSPEPFICDYALDMITIPSAFIATAPQD